MKTGSNVVSFAAFCDTKAFSSAAPAEGIHAVPATPKKIGKALENKGLPPLVGPPGSKHFGSKSKSSSKKKKATSSHSSKAPKVMRSPGPDGHLLDCAAMNATNLRLAYLGEYTSWRNRKSVCKMKHNPWHAAWNEFRVFLRDMGPKASPADTLNRIDNDDPAYGPGLCQWADKFAQNNNKGNNVKITVPWTGEVFTVAEIAKLHDVLPKTVYAWKAKGYTAVEMLAGKKNKHLLALNTALEALPATTMAKPPARKIGKPAPPKFSEWNPTSEELAHYNVTGEMIDSRMEEKLAGYKNVVDWVQRYNNGLPLPKNPPSWKYWRLPASLASKSSDAPKSMPKSLGPFGPSKSMPKSLGFFGSCKPKGKFNDDIS